MSVSEREKIHRGDAEDTEHAQRVSKRFAISMILLCVPLHSYVIRSK